MLCVSLNRRVEAPSAESVKAMRTSLCQHRFVETPCSRNNSASNPVYKSDRGSPEVRAVRMCELLALAVWPEKFC